MSKTVRIGSGKYVPLRFRIETPATVTVAIQATRPVWVMALSAKGYDNYMKGQVTIPAQNQFEAIFNTQSATDHAKGVLTSSVPVFAFSDTISTHTLSGWWYLLIGNQGVDLSEVEYDVWSR